MRSNFPADLDCIKETIKILHELYYLYYNIYLNENFFKDLEGNIEPYKSITKNEINDIIIRLNLLYKRDEINKIYEKYEIIKIKIIQNNKKMKNEKINIEKIKINEIIPFLSLFEIEEEMIFNFHIKDLISQLENNKAFKIINLFSQKLEVLDFILSTTSQDCRNLQELAGEVHGGNNQNFVSIEDLLTVEKIVENFETILKKRNEEKGKESIEEEKRDPSDSASSGKEKIQFNAKR